MGQTSPAQTKPKQPLYEILQYVVGKGYSIHWYCDTCDRSFSISGKRGIEFMIGNRVIDVIDDKWDYEVYINEHGPVHLKEINEETLRQAAETIVRRLMEDVTF
jgi:hypothetical protein